MEDEGRWTREDEGGACGCWRLEVGGKRQRKWFFASNLTPLKANSAALLFEIMHI